MAESTKSLVYRGPAQQVCYDLVEHGYSPILVPDAVYELPDAFADRLLASSAHFEASSGVRLPFLGQTGAVGSAHSTVTKS